MWDLYVQMRKEGLNLMCNPFRLSSVFLLYNDLSGIYHPGRFSHRIIQNQVRLKVESLRRTRLRNHNFNKLQWNCCRLRISCPCSYDLRPVENRCVYFLQHSSSGLWRPYLQLIQWFLYLQQQQSQATFIRWYRSSQLWLCLPSAQKPRRRLERWQYLTTREADGIWITKPPGTSQGGCRS